MLSSVRSVVRASTLTFGLTALLRGVANTSAYRFELVAAEPETTP